MKNLPVASVAIGACLLVLSSGVVFAARNPSGTGQPNQTCQNFGPTVRPGNAGSSPGSVFNEPGQNSPWEVLEGQPTMRLGHLPNTTLPVSNSP